MGKPKPDGIRIVRRCVTALAIGSGIQLAGSDAVHGTTTQSQPTSCVVHPGCPRAEVVRVNRAVSVDGHGGDDAWSSATMVPLVHNNGPDLGKAPALDSHLRLLWDDQHLHLLYRFASRNIKAVYTGRDVGVWDNPAMLDIAEAILDPDGRGLRYFEINATPGGGTLDCLVQWSRGKPAWDQSWPSQPLDIQIGCWKNHDSGCGGWTCEMAIPWSDLGVEPKPGLEIRADFFRADSDMKSPYLAWSPTCEGFFHVPERFGTLVLRETPDVSAAPCEMTKTEEK